MSYFIDAQTVLEEATSARAERVCFRTADDFSFAEVNLSSIESALSGETPEKYKLQRRVDRRWTDIGGYAKVFDSTRMFADLSRSADSVADVSRAELLTAIRSSPGRFHLSLKKILGRLGERLATRPNAQLVREWTSYFAGIEAHIDDDHFTYFISTIKLLEVALSNGLEDFVAEPDATSLKTLVSRIDGFASNFESAPSQIAALNLLGKIFSLIDRSAAADYFSLIGQKDDNDLISYFYTDVGALTYYSHGQVVSPQTSARTRSVQESIHEITVSQTGNELGILVSVDPNFFRIYSWLIYYYAQQLPHIDFNFLICCDQDSAEQLISDGEMYAEALSTLNKSGMPENVGYFRIPVPDFANQQKTFYACARFYAVERLLKEYPQVYSMDADLMFTEDPTKFFSRVRNLRVAAPESVGLTYLSPWRRHLAGNIPLNSSVLNTDFLSDLQDYISYGLAAKSSWMLDQNALTYSIEKNFPNSSVSLNKYNRPIYGPKFRSTWERNYFSRS
ncbi:hypothetical protein [Brevibacterium limosum]|uniref:hypothetical protein n=1 Tax=Brevibacterium limosum TaxID=2697565 RepID=UPI00141DBD9F|nr:hypothetical protein [Brevibacterium limosum]